MSKTLKAVKVEFPKRADVELRNQLMHCKGGPMRDRRVRRPNEKKTAWKKEL